MYRFNYRRILVHCQVISSKLAELVTGHGGVYGTGACARTQGECRMRGGVKGSLCTACRQGVLQTAPKVLCRGLNAHGVSSFAMRDSRQGEGKEVGCLRGTAVHKRVGEVRQCEELTREEPENCKENRARQRQGVERPELHRTKSHYPGVSVEEFCKTHMPQKGLHEQEAKRKQNIKA